MSELRYHPFLDQWVICATHRQDRTYHPPSGSCPLCPSSANNASEIPFAEYEIVVFENRFPSLSDQVVPDLNPTQTCPVRPANGVCEVVCYSDDHEASLGTLPINQVRKLVRVWRDRYSDLAAKPEVEYVFIFENRGSEVGVTLSHPHGQIYAYPFVPPIARQFLESAQRHRARTNRNLWEQWMKEEQGGPHVVDEKGVFWAMVPPFGRFPYELWVVPNCPVRTLLDFDAGQLDELAQIVHSVAKRYDRLFGFTLPYMMAMHQMDHPDMRFHLQFLPLSRTADKLKFLAGSESGAGAFILDVVPEEAARALRALS